MTTSVRIRLAAAMFLLVGACATDPGADPGLGDDDVLDGKFDDASTTGATLDYKSYEVLFTNPLCRTYEYDTPVETVDGEETLARKPKNVFCTKAADFGNSANRPSSPQFRLLEWIKGLGAGDEVFLAYLSFSNSAMGGELCKAAQRGVKVTFVLDAPTDLSNNLEGCGGTVLIRGHQGGIGYAHNKIVFINPGGAGPGDADPDYVRLVFSSGNMSSGVVMHHENWHFITVARKSYFAEAHRCLMQAQLDESKSDSKTHYRTYLNSCRAAIDHPREDDIRAYFIPSSTDSRAITRRMLDGVASAAAVDVGAHRFGHPQLVSALAEHLQEDEDFRVRMVADDDLYWLKPQKGQYQKLGDNELFEAENVEYLEESGGDRYEIRYAETNSEEHLLHHNKYLIYRDADGRPTSLLCGAANLTNTGFTSNFENIYWVKIPHVLDQFDAQFARVWDGQKASPDEQDPPVATPVAKMPASYSPAVH